LTGAAERRTLGVLVTPYSKQNGLGSRDHSGFYSDVDAVCLALEWIMFERSIIVLSHSWKTRAALVFGIVGFLVFMLAARFHVPEPVLTGQWAPLNEVTAQIVRYRYEALAYGTLGSSVLCAIKCFRRDYRRVFGPYV
jgi:hypothetical protein